MRSSILLSILVVVGCSPAAETQPGLSETIEADVAAVRAITDRFDEALNVGDYEALAALYHEDAMRMPAEAPAQIGQEAIREWFRLEVEQFDVQIDNVVRETQIVGDWAFSWGDGVGTLTARDGSGTRTIDSKWMSVAKRDEDGTWKAYWDIYNSNVPLEPPQG
jgi:uncharacterized protein (TIGR02246 family)